MFRIHFDYQTGTFVLQVAIWFGLTWRTVQGRIDEPGYEPLRFATFDEAKKHASAIGLDRLYADKSANQFRAHMSMAPMQA